MKTWILYEKLEKARFELNFQKIGHFGNFLWCHYITCIHFQLKFPIAHGIYIPTICFSTTACLLAIVE